MRDDGPEWQIDPGLLGMAEGAVGVVLHAEHDEGVVRHDGVHSRLFQWLTIHDGYNSVKMTPESARHLAVDLAIMADLADGIER